MGTKIERTKSPEQFIAWAGFGKRKIVLNGSLENGHCLELAAILTKKAPVVYFGVTNGKIDAKGAESLLLALPQCESLHSIILTRCNLNEESAGYIALILNETKNLAELDLSLNYLGSEAIKPIATALKKNNTLKSLSLSENEIGDEGAEALAEGLLENTTLEGLFLEVNGIGDDGAVALASSLLNNSSLLTLGLHGNEIQATGGDKLVRLLERNTYIQLFVGKNQLPENVKQRIKALLGNTNKRQFESAFKRNARVPWQRGKVMVVGEPQTGKTATVRSLLNLEFQEGWDSTVGIEISLAKTNSWGLMNKLNHLGGSYAELLAHQASIRSSEEKARRRQSVRRLNQHQKPTTIDRDKLVLHEKSTMKDLFETEQDWRATYAYDHQLNRKVQQEKDDIICSIWDYGGQRVFQSLHHIFLTKFGLYLVVFDMRYCIVGTGVGSAMEHVNYWMRAVAMHAPKAPVILVGTFADKISASQLNSINSTLFYSMPDLMQSASLCKPPSGLAYVPISNKSRRGVDELQAFTGQVMRKQEFVNKRVSINWMRTLDVIHAQNYRFTTLDGFTVVANFCGIKDAVEVQDMLLLFHELGVLLYFSASEALRSRVVTDPQWLIDSMGQIVRDKATHEYDTSGLKELGLQRDMKDLFELGIVSREVLDFLWEKDQVDYLIALMEHLLLMSRWKYDAGDELYLLPPMIPAKQRRMTAFKRKKDNTAKKRGQGTKIAINKSTSSEVLFTFRFLPSGVFERIVCLCIAYTADSVEPSSKPPGLVKGKAQVWFDEKTSVYMEVDMEEEEIVAYVSHKEKAEFVLNLLLTQLKRIRDEFLGTSFTWETQVKVRKKMYPLEVARQKQYAPWFRQEMPKSQFSLVSATSEGRLDSFLDA